MIAKTGAPYSLAEYGRALVGVDDLKKVHTVAPLLDGAGVCPDNRRV